MLTKVLNSTIYKLKTGHGISARHYMSNQLRRILGTGQGSGASPCIWTLVLDTILWSVALKHSCFQITSPSGTKTHRVGDAFVDDTSIFLLLPPHQDMVRYSPQDLADKIAIIAQDFERKLYSTGGNLSLSKCFWYLIDWVWDDDGTAKMRKINQGNAVVSLTQGKFSKKHIITREEIDTAIRTIGVRVNPMGNHQIEYEHRLQYTTKWTNLIKKL